MYIIGGITLRWAIVTGTSTGIGEAITLGLLKEKVNVIAGIRKQSDGQKLIEKSKNYSAKLVPVELDVTKDEQIEAVLVQASELVGADGLWALVNNAGVVVPGPLEFLTRNDWRRQFEINFFGMTEMTRVFLPLLRKGVAAQGSGVPRIMLVSSIGGRVPQPMLSAYTCSKFATTALGDSLRLELKRQGIGVTVLEPGAIATAIWNKGAQAASDFTPDHPARQIYNTEIDGLTMVSRKTAAGALAADKAGEIAVQALVAQKAPARVLVGDDAKLAALLKQLLPLAVFDRLIASQFGIASPSV
ncbi:MAG: SDR family NAD(P)-dependent oxidoreductase [Leptolyngbya sp.]|nr:SDR family NAD(P)-dependent oxidoreductase [Candidatus Melainabacteria bacterium]